MHDIIHRELQNARLADFHRRAQQDRLGREAALHLRRGVLGRVLVVLSGRSALRQLAARAWTADAPTLDAPADVRGARSTPSRAHAVSAPVSDPRPAPSHVAADLR
jgi:hypothetical protein